jgi:hypothetical protein
MMTAHAAGRDKLARAYGGDECGVRDEHETGFAQ